MGNCFDRKNKVGVINSILSSDSGNENKMKALKQLEKTVNKGGVAFVIEMDQAETGARPASGLHSVQVRPARDVGVQSMEDKQQRAELAREESKIERRLRASQERQRCQEAMARRLAKAEEMKKKLEAKEREHEKDIEERRRNLQELAQRTREARQRKAKKQMV